MRFNWFEQSWIETEKVSTWNMRDCRCRINQGPSHISRCLASLHFSVTGPGFWLRWRPDERQPSHPGLNNPAWDQLWPQADVPLGPRPSFPAVSRRASSVPARRGPRLCVENRPTAARWVFHVGFLADNRRREEVHFGSIASEAEKKKTQPASISPDGKDAVSSLWGFYSPRIVLCWPRTTDRVVSFKIGKTTLARMVALF